MGHLFLEVGTVGTLGGGSGRFFASEGKGACIASPTSGASQVRSKFLVASPTSGAPQVRSICVPPDHSTAFSIASGV